MDEYRTNVPSETEAPPIVIHEVKDYTIGLVYNLAFFIGLTGLHSFYLGNSTKGTIQLVMGPLVQLSWLLVISLVTFSIGFYIFAPISVILVVISLGWQLIDLYNLEKYIYDYNSTYFTSKQQGSDTVTDVNVEPNKPIESFYFHPTQKELNEMEYPKDQTQEDVTNP